MCSVVFYQLRYTLSFQDSRLKKFSWHNLFEQKLSNTSKSVIHIVKSNDEKYLCLRACLHVKFKHTFHSFFCPNKVITSKMDCKAEIACTNLKWQLTLRIVWRRRAFDNLVPLLFEKEEGHHSHSTNFFWFIFLKSKIQFQICSWKKYPLAVTQKKEDTCVWT